MLSSSILPRLSSIARRRATFCVAPSVVSYALLFILFASLSACSGRGEKGALAPDAPPDQVPEIAGSYVVNGFDPLGTEYSGRLEITPGAQPGEYMLKWIITGSIQEGTGVLQGNQLQVAWRLIEGLNQQASGTGVYTVTTRGQLHGERWVDGYERPGNEAAYPND